MAEAATLIGRHEPDILTVDNGATNTRLARSERRIVGIDSYSTPKNYDVAIEQIARRTHALLGGKKPDGIGFSVAGKVGSGRIISAGKLQENGWCGRPFAADVAAAIGISPDNINLLNDCAAGATAEHRGRKGSIQNLGGFMVLSTGFGAALYRANGEIIGDEPGHFDLKPGAMCGCGVEGHIEAHVSGSGIKDKFSLSDDQPYLLHDDPRWNEVKCDLEMGMLDTLERYREEYGVPEIIGFTGGVALGGPRILEDLQRDLNQQLGKGQAPLIEEAVYGEDSGLYGAAFAARSLLLAA